MSSKVIKCLSPLSVNERALLIEDAKIIMAHDGSSYEDAMIESANDIIAEYVGHKNTALKEVIAQFESRNESVKTDPVKQQSSKPENKYIGENSDGDKIYEKPDGSRYLDLGGVLENESVRMVPSREGLKIERNERKEKFIATNEKELVKTEVKPESVETQKTDNAASDVKETDAYKKAKSDLDEALGDLGEVFLAANLFAKKAVPTALSTKDLMPVLTRVMDAAFRMGYAEFKANAKFVLDTIRDKFGDPAADSITIKHLKGAYIGMGEGTTSEEDVIAIKSIEELVLPANNYVKSEKTKQENDNVNNTGTKTNAGNDTGKAPNQSGISDQQPRQPKQDGAANGNRGIRTGSKQSDAVDSSQGERNGLSIDEGLAGYSADGRDQQSIQQHDSKNGSLSKHIGANNYSLIDKEPIALTPAKRRDVNILATEILNKPVNEITEADKDILRQYTGNGGLDVKASEDKGDGIFNQHYTAYDTIKAMYGALMDAGIKMKNNLEPSVGSGNFIGMNPRANWTAVDIDKTNTEIVKRLYPDAQVFNESYETFRRNNYDLIISNVPFASFSELAREHAGTIKPMFKAIHNFFFAQSVDKLKTGGVMAFMTSTGTMDGTGEGQRLRASLIKQMDVIGAFRLPMGTQKANASTDVMIDVIFLQKRPDGVKSKQPEKNQAFVDIANKDGHKINQYFVDYPESVLGELSIGKNKTSMGRIGWIVTGEADYSKMKIEPQDYTATEKTTNKVNEFADNEAAKAYADKHGYKFVDQQTVPFFKDGIIYDIPVAYNEQDGGGLFGRKATGVNAEKLAALQKIDETHDAELVNQYEDRYNKPPHTDKLLELWAKTNHAAQQLKSYLALFDKHFNLSEIFTKQVRFKDSGKIEIDEHSPLLDRAESLENADGIISGKSDLVSESERQDLLDGGHYAQLANGSLQNSRLYYAGNIYQKLDDATKVRPAAQRDKQIAKLEKAKPALIGIKNISITGKESWLSDSAIASIGKQTFPDGAVIIGENAIEDRYLLTLFNQYVNNQSLVKKDKDDTPEEYAEKLKTAQSVLHNEVLPLIKQKLIDDGLADEIVNTYNRAKNFFAPPVFDGSSLRNLPTTFKGKPFSLMGHQLEGAERAIYNKKGVLAFSPGLGKTPTAIIIADQLLQKGVMKKPLFIVPANTIPQWESSTRSLYPNAKVYEFPKYTSGINKGKPKEWPSMTAADKEKMVYDLTNNQYDYTFISTNLAQKFAVPTNKLSQYLDELTESISSMEKPDEELNKSQIKAKQTRLAKIRMLKATMMAAYRDSNNAGFDMGKMGFDALFADEVQYYKNIGMQSEEAKGGIGANVAINATYPNGQDGKPDKELNPISVTLGSSRSYDFRFKTRFISENNNGNNVFLLTGTPTPNKPLELMTLLHHLDTHILDEYGINNVGEFVDEFLDVQSVEEMSVDGTNKLKPQLVGIKNIFGLKKIISRYVDYRSPESAKDLTRPTQIDKTHVVLQNSDAEAIFADIQERILQSIEDANAKKKGDKDVVVEPMIKMYGAGRDGSIDVRLYSPSQDGKGSIAPGTVFKKETRAEYSKIAKTVELVAAKNKLDPEAGQLIFLDRLKFSDGSGSTHEDIRNDVLKATGLKPQEVVFVNGGEYVNPNTGKVAKSIKPEMLQTIMDKYNAGDIKVLIGNTSKLGVGVDLQVTTTDIYQIDKPYRPDEIEQRNNRGVRQGNRNSEVTVHTFNQPGTFDAMSDRIIANKQGFNDVFWKDQDSDRADVKGEEAPSHYDAAIELERDPVKKRKLEIERDLQQASSKTNQIEKQISSFAKRIRTATQNKLSYENANKNIETRETPKYEDQSEAERKKSVAAFKKRMADQHALNVGRISDIEADLVELEASKADRVKELEQHKENINDIRLNYVVNGVVSLDAIKDRDLSFSKSTTETSGSTVADITALLPKRVKALLDAGKLKVVQSVKDLPEHLQDAGNFLAHTVWHGSPHDHNKFDSSKIGTGEGAQAFGYGLYFTDKKDIAEWYRDKLSNSDGYQRLSINGKNYEQKNTFGNVWYDENDNDYDNNDAIGLVLNAYKNNESIADYADHGLFQYEDHYKEALKLNVLESPNGKLYEVELAPELDEYLDWNKPLSEQSEKVKSILSAAGFKEESKPKPYSVEREDEGIFNIKDGNGRYLPVSYSTIEEAQSAADSLTSQSFENFKNKQRYGFDIYNSLKDKTNDFSGKSASDYLHSLGIRGIKYAAEGGKSDANNYVVFSDEDVSISAKYSMLDGVEALYDGKRDELYLVADMLNKNNLSGVLGHELIHRAKAQDPKVKAALERFEQYFQDSFNRAAKGVGSKIEREAYARVIAAKTKKSAQIEEHIAYIITAYERNPESFPARLVKAIKDFIGAIRAALVRSGLDFGYIKSLTPADLAALSGYGAKVDKTLNPSNSTELENKAMASTKAMPETIKVNGKDRPTRNSNGQLIHSTEEGIRNFYDWLGDSKVVDDQGRPLVVYHGTASTNITSFMPDGGDPALYEKSLDLFREAKRKNEKFGYMNFRSGSFFSADPSYASHYTNENSGVVYVAYLKAENPIYMNQISGKVSGTNPDKTPDALIMVDNGIFNEIAIIDPTQIKSATGNNGQFSPDNADIRYSKNTTPVNSDPFENPKDVVKNLVGAEARNLPHWDDVKSSIIGGFQKMGSKERKEMLGFLSLRNLADLAETVGILPILNQSYVPTIQKMVAAQNKITSEAGKLSETWLKLYTSNRSDNENLVSLMGDETTSGIDGSKPWVSKLTPEQVQEIIDKKPSEATKRAIRLDKKRRAKHAELSRRYNELPPAFRAMHDQVRDTYQKWFDNRYKALQDRILDEEGTSTAKAQRIDSIRAVFESMQVDGPYFPLPRFGDYWVKGVDKDGNIFVESVETLEQQTALKKEILSDGGIIKAEGVKPSELSGSGEVSADFIAKVDEMVKTLGNNEAVNEVRDGMYQLYLSTLPSLSNRKHHIHRKNRLGWSRDMLRAFSEIGLHEAKQYSKLKYGHKLDQIISDMGSGIGMAENPANRSKAEKKIALLLEAFDESESDKGRAAIRNMIDRLERRIEISRKARYQGNFEFARNIHSEVQQQYKAMMEPSTAGWATVVNAVGFGWFLGGSIMSGVVNTAQNMLTVNAAAAELESIKGLSALPIVAKEFALAAKDFVTHTHDGQADIAGGLKTMGERRAYVQFNQHELFDKTQGHDLSGIAQEGFKAGSFARYVTTKLGFFFHHAERFNRQVSAIAIYRAAIKSDMHHQAAADLAERLVWKTHYDYSAWNRARHLRSPVARMTMQFKQYGMSTAFLLGESWYKSVWKDPNISVKDRRKARAFFGGVMASQMILAGAQGLPAGLATVMLAAGALGARGVPFTKAINISIGLTAAAAMALALGLGDDDDDNDQFIDDTEAWVKQWLADHVGKTWEQLIMSGVIDSLTPVGLSNRVSMNGLLVRSSDKEMEGDPTAAWAAWAQTFLGPTAGGMTFDMLFLGPDLMNRGEIWKGLEYLMPTAARGLSKAIRGQVNGITNMAGNQIVKDVTPVETALQFMGDTPSRISRQYDLNNAEKNRESRIANRRKELLRDMNKARTAGDTEEMNSIRAEIVKFNQQNRESAITGKTIIQSAKSKARIERKSEGGLYLKDGREYDF